MTRTTGILADGAIKALFAGGKLKSEADLDADQVQPASLDLRLGGEAYRVRASFLPGRANTVEARLEALEAQVRAAERLLAAEQTRRGIERGKFQSGLISSLEAEQADYRVVEAESWLGALRGWRDEAQARLERARRLAAAGEEPAEESLEDRIRELEQEIEALQVESLMQQRFNQMPRTD